MLDIKYWKSYGIHTRVQNLINHVGGIDVDKRVQYIMETYNISIDDAFTLLRVPIEDYLAEGITIEELVANIRRKSWETMYKLGIMYSMTCAISKFSDII